MNRSYDDWKLEGNTHRCVCGAIWTDADGEPCHGYCEDCGSITEIDELNMNLDRYKKDVCDECAGELV